MMVLFVIGGVVVAAFVALVIWADGKRQDEILNLVLAQSFDEARAKLSDDDIGRLNAQLMEIRDIGREAHRSGGVSARQATRAGKQAAIQTISAFMEIDRMFMGRDAA